MTDAAIEAAARAICKARGEDPDDYTGFVAASNPPHRVRKWEPRRAEARAAVIAYLEATMEPTPEVLDACDNAMRVWLLSVPEHNRQSASGAIPSRKKAKIRFKAMRSSELDSLKGIGK